MRKIRKRKSFALFAPFVANRLSRADMNVCIPII